MRATTRVYWRLLVAGFRRQSRYRLAALGGLVANSTFGLLKVVILFATVRAGGGAVEGYDVGLMSAYVWISQGLLGSVNLSGRSEMAERVKSGDVAVDFLRPVDVQGAAIATEVGRSLFNLLPRGLPAVLIGALVVGMAMPTHPAPYLLGAVSLLLGIVVAGATVYLIAALGFWLVDTRGLQIFYLAVSGFLAGLFVPIPLFPAWLEALAHATPFPAMLQYPVDVITARVDLAASLGLVGAQLAWLLVIGGLGQLLTRAGRRHLEVQGG
ncbi:MULTISPECIES: ABC transporter permease [Nocardioides]|uniref:ABC transporter permease n=1 Tax=Nocardioides vastitatis TaxID=2568655 RepID=A0ABW0ZK64_9ACTN|nr:ABC-2 family transporter protein [Nocardioides sp.]THJ01629.1 ABC transporter permease [Nocardioides sp.]